jgi:hypothetical protein
VHQDEDEGRRASRSRDKRKSEEVVERDQEDEDEEGAEDGRAKKSVSPRPQVSSIALRLILQSALESILDFLGDQSD